MIDESNNDNGSGVGDDEVYRDKGKKPVLASLLDLYSEINVILIDINDTLLVHLTLSTDYFPNQIVYYFDLIKSFLSKQYLKGYYCSFAWTDHKRILQYEASTMKVLPITSTKSDTYISIYTSGL